jgi:hypothetical protein
LPLSGDSTSTGARLSPGMSRTDGRYRFIELVSNSTLDLLETSALALFADLGVRAALATQLHNVISLPVAGLAAQLQYGAVMVMPPRRLVCGVAGALRLRHLSHSLQLLRLRSKSFAYIPARKMHTNCKVSRSANGHAAKTTNQMHANMYSHFTDSLPCPERCICR